MMSFLGKKFLSRGNPSFLAIRGTNSVLQDSKGAKISGSSASPDRGGGSLGPQKKYKIHKGHLVTNSVGGLAPA
jgi:hypothetical protein